MLIQIYKLVEEDKPSSFNLMILLSYSKKVVESALATEIRKYNKFHRAQLGFQNQTGTEIATARCMAYTKQFRVTAILDLKLVFELFPRVKAEKILKMDSAQN